MLLPKPKATSRLLCTGYMRRPCCGNWSSGSGIPCNWSRSKASANAAGRPIVLTVEQYYQILTLIPEPYRTMVVVAQCTGLRAEEVLALEWEDIDFENLHMRVVRAVVHGRAKWVKTVDLVFASPVTGRHYHTAPIQQDYIRPAGWCLVNCPKCGSGIGAWCKEPNPTPNGRHPPIHEERRTAAGKFDGVGWHTFRHTYRSWLDDTGAPIGAQQKLMRHAQISTTMNIYGNALMAAKREANSKVVRMALRSA